MKRIIVIAAALALTVSVQAQSQLGNLLNGVLGGKTTTTTSSDGSTSADVATSTLNNVLGNLLGTVAKPKLSGTYNYNGVAVSMTSKEGGIVSNLAGTAVTTTIEAKIDEMLAKVGIKPGAMTVKFDDSDNTFVWTIAEYPFNGTWRLDEVNNTITLTFGKTLKYLCMTGNIDLTLDGVKLLFTSEKTTEFLKKVLAQLGQKKTDIGSIAQLAAGYDDYKIGFKLSK